MSDYERVFVDLVESRYDALVRSAYLLTGNLEPARDLVQTALTKAYARRVGMRDPVALEHYVRRCVVNLHISSWRRHRGRESPVAEPPEPASRLTGDEPTTAALAERVAVSVDVWAALQTLAPRQRTAIVLRYFEDLPISAVARLMDCGEQSVKTHTARGLANLRGRLGEEAEGRIGESGAAAAVATLMTNAEAQVR